MLYFQIVTQPEHKLEDHSIVNKYRRTVIDPPDNQLVPIVVSKQQVFNANKQIDNKVNNFQQYNETNLHLMPRTHDLNANALYRITINTGQQNNAAHTQPAIDIPVEPCKPGE